ncbi:Glycoside hydrolase family 16 protein [Mycena kentingensis (nom. inval.)]|nr:Glycoside hydrolase family 16 protein [Mycena kentingensis (nom. inval.)]
MGARNSEGPADRDLTPNLLPSSGYLISSWSNFAMDYHPLPSPTNDHRRRITWAFFFTLALASYIYSLDSTTTFAYLSYAVSEFGRHNLLGTIQVAQGITIAVGKPIIAKVADVGSRGTAFCVVLIFYLIGYAAITVAPNITVIAAGIVFYAIGFTGLQLLTQVVIADVTTLQWRGLVISLSSFPFLINVFIGSNISAAIIEHAGWRWGYAMFIVLIPLGLAPLIYILFTSERQSRRRPPLPKKPILQRLVDLADELDAIGLFLIGASTSLILLPLSLAQHSPEGIKASRAPALFTLGILLIPVFAWWDFTRAKSPVIPFRFVVNHSVVGASLIGALDFMAFYLTFTYLYSFIIVVKDWKLVHATYFTQIQSWTMTACGFFTGMYMHRYRRYKSLLVAGLVVRLIGVLLMLRSRGPDGSTFTLILTQVLQGIGGGVAALSIHISSQASVTPSDIAMTTAVVLLITEFGAAGGGAIAGAIWSDQMPERLARYLPSLTQAERDALFGSITKAASKPRGDPIRDGVIAAYGDVMKSMVVAASIVSVLPVLIAFTMPDCEWHDAHSVVKYTDIDYRVFSDAARFLLKPTDQNVAQGPLKLPIGDPYTRETYRYTPLLALLLAPNEWLHPAFGKYLFATCDILGGLIIYDLLVSCIRPLSSPGKATLYSALHLLNPLMFTISTRGSSEAVLSLFVLVTLYAALKGRWNVAAVALGLSAHWKIYPVIYGVACLGVVGGGKLVSWRTIRFMLLSASTFVALGAGCYLVWGYPFLYESYLYHLHRLDHRHNFSPYFYLIYLTYPTFGQAPATDLSLWSRVLRSPLTSFVPQMGLSIGAGLVFGRRKDDLVFAWFVQTVVFVVFNKVCTSQYFLWYLLLLPLLLPRLSMRGGKTAACLAVWVGTQALWLSEAYKLEFLGKNVYFGLWVRGLLASKRRNQASSQRLLKARRPQFSGLVVQTRAFPRPSLRPAGLEKSSSTVISQSSQFHPKDSNVLSVLTYAVDHLGVEHVVIVGHSECGGAAACFGAAHSSAFSETATDLVIDPSLPADAPLNQWLTPLTKLVASLKLSSVSKAEALPVIVEENVKKQVENLSKASTIVNAWAHKSKQGKDVWIHGWVYDLAQGQLRDLGRTNPGEGTRLRKAPTTSRPTLARTATVNTRFEQNLDLDDVLHNPDPVADARLDRKFDAFSSRGWINGAAMVLVFGGLLMLFAGYPLLWHFTHPSRRIVGFNLGGINGSGQVPQLSSFPSMIDQETPQSAYSYKGTDGKKYNLVFSDEFNVDGRSFYPGDDPYWYVASPAVGRRSHSPIAVDFHYWPTGDFEWYDPGAITTKNGKLVITMTEKINHNLNFMSGMLQSWNKVCFTNGYVEVSISLPGAPNQPGFWPGAWMMGNLGRAGYGATTEGMWPYSYDSCDLGTFPNQTTHDNQPSAVHEDSLSYLPGQRLSACTCPGSDHPGPKVSNGRGVPEIDILEAQVEISGEAPYFRGEVSQSFQVAPYSFKHQYNNNSDATPIVDSSMSKFNNYKGNQFQESVSVVTYIDDQVYGGKAFGKYGLEWNANPSKRSNGYINWLSNDKKTWSLTSDTIGPDPDSQVSQRLIAEEPMYLIFNLGMSPGFQKQDFEHMVFPAEMQIDYVRVYQQSGQKDALTCDPPNYPTADYISGHFAAYNNPNLTTWAQAGYTFPRNSLYDGC